QAEVLQLWRQGEHGGREAAYVAAVDRERGEREGEERGRDARRLRDAGGGRSGRERGRLAPHLECAFGDRRVVLHHSVHPDRTLRRDVELWEDVWVPGLVQRIPVGTVGRVLRDLGSEGWQGTHAVPHDERGVHECEE